MASNVTRSDLDSTANPTAASKVKVIDLLEMPNVTLNDKIANVIQEISSESLAGLTESIKKDNVCREPVLAYRDQSDGTLYLVDGFTRVNICIRHELTLPRGLLINDLHDRGAAIQWRIDQHINRRNLCPRWISYLWGAKYNSEKLAPHRPSENAELPQTEGETAQRIAEQAGVSRATIERNARFAQSIDQLKSDLGDEFGKKILNREFKNLSLVDINNLVSKSIDDKKAIANALGAEPELSLQEAERIVHPSTAGTPLPENDQNTREIINDEESQQHEDSNDSDQVLKKFNNRLIGYWSTLQSIDRVNHPEHLHNVIRTLEDLIKRLREIKANSSSS